MQVLIGKGKKQKYVNVYFYGVDKDRNVVTPRLDYPPPISRERLAEMADAFGYDLTVKTKENKNEEVVAQMP